jgi:glycosyltransferase involved in cell wall biosynthesis
MTTLSPHSLASPLPAEPFSRPGQTASVSVIIPAYNPPLGFLVEALQSVAAQTVPIHEILLVDDGSATPVESALSWRHPALRILRTVNQGIGAARNHGIRHSTGDYVAFLDADDLWEPTKLEAQLRAFQQHPEAVGSYTRCVLRPGFFGFGPYPPDLLTTDPIVRVLWYSLFFPPSTVLVRRQPLFDVGLFREGLGNGEDIELWFRLFTRGPFVQVPEPLTAYRVHPQQFTSSSVRKFLGGKQARRVMIEQHRDLLARVGIPPQAVWNAYRNDILGVYFRRDFASSRRLLWDYWRDHPADFRVFCYACISLLPAAWVARLRGQVGKPAPTTSEDTGRASPLSWEQAVDYAKQLSQV